MLRIVQSASSGRAKSYYSSADYYTQGQELTGVWRGEGARLLGLAGEVTPLAWDRLCDNLDPRTGERLTARTDVNRRVGYDLNFHVPKSVSVLYGLTQDEQLLEAFRESIQVTMIDIERDMKTRVRKGGRADGDRLTGNMVWGEFVHTTSRPVDGVPCPHLHAHCFAFNATFDTTENRWKAGQFGELKRDGAYYEALFHSRLASNLQTLGLPVVRTKRAWELAGIEADVISLFSRRTRQIETLAEEQGITSPKAKAELGALTREPKRPEQSLNALRTIWSESLNDSQRHAVAAAAGRIGGAAMLEQPGADRQAIDHATQHCFERSSVVPERTLLTEALRFGVGRTGAQPVLDAFARSEFITGERSGRRVVTTREVFAEEQRMLNFAREGRGRCQPLGKGSVHHFTEQQLNADQRAAVRHVLESPDRVMLIRGGAGVGKTTMMIEAARAIESAGTPVFTFAPSADASRDTLRKSGFENAETVAMLLTNPELQEQARGGVLWIDEAGQLGTGTLDEVFTLASTLECRVILSGDTRQHGSVSRGAALRLLEEEAGLKPAEIREIMRQSGAYKSAIRALSEGRIDSGFKQLDQLGWIKEVPDAERYEVLAKDYVDSTHSGSETLVVCPTHREGDRVTDDIRQRLQHAGRLGKIEREIPVLNKINLTEAERGDVAQYVPGDRVVFQRNGKGYRKGQTLAFGKDAIPFDLAARFGVFREETIKIARGDRLRITANGKSRDGAAVYNGALKTVAGFTRSGDIKLEDGQVLPQSFGHLAYGYVITSHVSQSKSVSTVLVAQSAESLPASNREQFYVSVSRGKRRAAIYTDSKAELLEAVTRSDERLTATELVNDVPLRIARERLAPPEIGVKESPATRQQHRQQPSDRALERTFDRAS